MDESALRSLLDEFLKLTHDMAGAIGSEDMDALERLIAAREEIIGKIGGNDPGRFPELMEKIREQDEKNNLALQELLEGYKDGVRRMKLSQKSVRLYTGTDLPPDAGYFDKKS